MNDEDKKIANDIKLHLDDSQNIELVEENLKHQAKENAIKVAQSDAEKARNEAAKGPVDKMVADALHNDSPVKPLRTFQGDVADAIERQKTSLIQIKIAEEKRQENEAIKHPQVSGARYGIRAIILVLSILLILTAGTIFAVTKFFAGAPAPTPAVIYDTLIPYDSIEKVNVANDSRSDIIATFTALRGEPAQPSTIKYLKFTDGAVGDTTISTTKFLNLLSTKASQGLIRSFDDTFMAGGYGGKRIEPFILVRINSFDNAYSGMLAWENSMAEDVGALFTPQRIAFSTAVTQITSNSQMLPATTSTSTDSQPPNTKKGVFEDLVVDNRDTRAVRDDHGSIVFMYSFVDRNLLLLTTNEEAFKGILNKLVASKLIR